MFETKELKINHAHIVYDVCDPQDRSQPPKILFLFINGFQRTRADFRALRTKLHKTRSDVASVALDNRLTGMSYMLDPEHDVTPHDFAKDCLRIIEAEQARTGAQKVAVLGISMGGMIAQELCSLAPKGLISQLYLVSTTAGGPNRVWSKSFKDPKNYSPRPTDLEGTQKLLTKYFGSSFLQKSPLLFDLFCKTMLKVNTSQNLEGFAHKQFYAFVGFDFVDRLKLLGDIQTYIFSGDEDNIIPFENSVFMKEHIPGSTLFMYENIGHLILIEHPDVFLNDIVTCLKNI